jgi:hypothetical protein
MVDDIRRRWPSVPRSDQQKNMRPTFVNQARQFHSIDRPRQLNIREQDADVLYGPRPIATGLVGSGSRSQLLTYIRLPDAA